MLYTPTFLPLPVAPRGVAILVHGLNLQPERMLPLGEALQAMGMAVLPVALYGHGENYTPLAGQSAAAARMASYRRVSHARWQADLQQGYDLAQAWAAPLGLPIYLVAFSLGGLLGCELLVTNPAINFARLVLFAPALVLQPYSHLPRLLKAWPGLTIRSFSPATYRANPATPIAAYLALQQALHNLRCHLSERLNRPTLLFIARRDELVSAKGLARFIQQAQLTHWQLDIVHKQGSGLAQRYHHLIIDPASVGTAEWARLIGRIERFLVG